MPRKSRRANHWFNTSLCNAPGESLENYAYFKGSVYYRKGYRHVDFCTMEESTEQSKWQTNYLEEVIRESASRLGYKELKHEQMKAILSFVQGNDTFVGLSTGYGKSLIY